MNNDFNLLKVKAEAYVSPSLEATAVRAERGFCDSTIQDSSSAGHDGFDPFTPAE